MLIAVELGGSSRQTCVFLRDEAALLVDGGSVVSPGARYGLAAPRVFRDGRPSSSQDVATRGMPPPVSLGRGTG